MSDQSSTVLPAQHREPGGSRDARRLRRTGMVPGVVYGGGADPVSFQINERELRHALANAGAVLDLEIDGKKASPVVLKELVRHPVSGDTTHIDLLRVRLDVAIHAQVIIDLIGGEDAPGVKEGGVLEQTVREITVSALPTAIPDSIQHDVSALEIGDSLTVAVLVAPPGVTILADPEQQLVAVNASRMARALDDIETETELVGEGEGDAEGESADGAEASAEGADGAPTDSSSDE
jgi:large subunit ribosomal protein L25